MRIRPAIWLLIFCLLSSFSIPATAQTEVVLETLSVDLLPEYDDPDMLIIEKFRLPVESALPVDMTFHLPALARVNAIAYEQNGSLFYVPSARLSIEDGLQIATFRMEYPLEYRIEYYMPLERSGSIRKFTYQWAGDYALSRLLINLNLPPDATGISTMPALTGKAYTLTGEFPALEAGRVFTLAIQYQRSSNAVQTYKQPVESAQPLNSSPVWAERMLAFWPWILGLVGVTLIVGGGLYYWFSGRGKKTVSQKHHPVDKNLLHCHQCGQRAQPGDRFCRTCGTRLRQDR